MSVSTIERIVAKMETLSASDIIEIESLVDGFAEKSTLPAATLRALEDAETGNVVKCASQEELFEKLGI